MSSEQPEFEVAVIGAGPGGIAAGVKLLQAGVGNIVLLERADDVGGSWHENHYPGLGVDVPSFAYQYSFARNPQWSRLFPKGAEVKQYHVDVAKRFGVYERVRFNTNVEREEWDDEAGHWKLHTSDGTVVTTRFLVSAVGAFVRPKADIGIAGAHSFGGKIQRPTDWDHEFDMAGKSVGIIGTGASAVQIIPTIAPEVAHLTVFQRTPVWSLPKPDLTLGPFLRPLYAAPGVQSALNGAVLVLADVLLRSLSKAPFRWSRPVMDRFDAACIAAYRRYIRWVVDDPATAEKLTPNFGPLAKRPTISNGYLKAYNRNNVTLVPSRSNGSPKRASARAMVSNTDSMFSFSPPDMRFFRIPKRTDRAPSWAAMDSTWPATTAKTACRPTKASRCMGCPIGGPCVDRTHGRARVGMPSWR
ncbi:Putative monooxygenase [Mycobacteroides abscessus]|nr:Putative monooxygenase [Mycobacteroides abscessus]